MAPGTLGIAHGWGDPADDRPVEQKGTNVQALIPAHERYDRITGLARQSAYPVNLRKHEGRIGWRLAFNAAAPVLPGFERGRAFAL